MTAHLGERFVLSLDCPQELGTVHAVSGFLVEHECDILEAQQFDDHEQGWFFQRVAFAASPDGPDLHQLRAAFEPLAQRYTMRWRLRPEAQRTRVVLLVSRFGHCLTDLLFRARTHDLPIEVVAVVSNHRDHEGIVGWHSVPFFHVPVSPETKQAAEAELLRIEQRFDADLVVLARYMQVLSNDLTTELAGRCINIHHSFLPSFKGAKPYHQAHARGVKMVGATAHYVNTDLDEGPIIAQEVIPVDHTHSAGDLVAIGRDAEVTALAKAVRWHCEDRVFLQGNRTVILR